MALFFSCALIIGQNKTGEIEFQSDPDASTKVLDGMSLVFSDEFNDVGRPNEDKWGFEYGFVRNRELQWYQPSNASCYNGMLVIEGRREVINNINYNPFKDNWYFSRAVAEYSSASLITKGRYEFPKGGYYEIRARIDTSMGSWPAIWLLGT
jgi:beta-glucanase (GH16 family)